MELTLTHFQGINELGTLATDPGLTAKFGVDHMRQFAEQHTGTELFNAVTGAVSLWGDSACASWQDFWKYGPFTLNKDEGRDQELGNNVTGTMLTAIMGSYKLRYPQTYNAFAIDFHKQLKAARSDGKRARVPVDSSKMFGPAMRVAAPCWFITKTMPSVPKAQSRYHSDVYLKKEHPCLFAEDPGKELFTKVCEVLSSCGLVDEHTLHVSSLNSEATIASLSGLGFDGLDSFMTRVSSFK